MNTSRVIRVLAGTLIGLVIAVGIVWWQIDSASRMVPSPAAAVGGPFTLTDHTGKTVTDADFRDRSLLIYFGYTFCPDVCPTELATMARALDELGPAADKVVPLFISVDPKRDTVAHMADYVALFHPRLVGLTGTPEQVAAVAKAYRVYYAKAGDTSGDDYLMDHSSFVYWMGPDGKFVAVFPAGTTAVQMAEKLRAGPF